ncbi:MAG: PD-(D/E)XK nuclease family transposase [Lachnospiraceae bacterium]|nr:PD-(D/E)XK nuclease family transposase [Lachnospiraceae bacterium]
MVISEKEKQRQEDLKRIKSLRLIDDDFMTICFDNYIEGAELLLKIILDRDDLKVSEVKAQKVLKNLQGRDLRLDIYATDAAGKKYDIEIQRADKGAHQKRARYHSSLIDSDMLKTGEDFTELRENYVIFITENDVIGFNRPIYHVERVIREGGVQFEDDEHIIYVNGSMKAKDTALGKLMSDLYCTNADDMCYEALAERVRVYKETEEGVDTMCDVLDEMKKEAAEMAKYSTACEIAIKLIKVGKLSLDEIADTSGLSIEKVRELAGNKSA